VKFTIDAERVKTLLLLMINTSYFDSPKLAVEIYRDFIALYKITPQPVVLEEALRFYTSRHKGPRLKKLKAKGEYTTFEKG
jgi:hypothetical protein